MKRSLIKLSPRMLLGALLILGGAISCSSNDLKNADNPEVVYNEGVRLIGDERYIEATEFLNEVRRRFPQSRFAVLAELRAADSLYKQESYTEAAASYGTFVELYPNHADAAYALYRKALSYYNDAPDVIARDQAPAQNAADAADQLIKRYPQSPLVKDGQDLHLKSRMKLAKKEAYVAAWYEKKEFYLASYRRWKGMEFTFADLKDQPDAKKLLAEAKDHSAKIAEKHLTHDEQALPSAQEMSN